MAAHGHRPACPAGRACPLPQAGRGGTASARGAAQAAHTIKARGGGPARTELGQRPRGRSPSPPRVGCRGRGGNLPEPAVSRPWVPMPLHRGPQGPRSCGCVVCVVSASPSAAPSGGMPIEASLGVVKCTSALAGAALHLVKNWPRRCRSGALPQPPPCSLKARGGPVAAPVPPFNRTPCPSSTWPILSVAQCQSHKSYFITKFLATCYVFA